MQNFLCTDNQTNTSRHTNAKWKFAMWRMKLTSGEQLFFSNGANSSESDHVRDIKTLCPRLWTMWIKTHIGNLNAVLEMGT